MFALNQGEVCTCPSRALVQESIYDRFMERAVARTKAIVEGNPLDPATMIGAQASNDQLEKILSYIDIGKKEGAKVLTGGARRVHPGELKEGYYVQPTILEGHNKMRVFQEEIFGPVVSVTKFKNPGRRARDRQRHALRARRRPLEPRREHLLPHGPRDQGGAGVDQLLSPVSGARRVRRVQAVGHRPRESPHDARPLPADQEHAGQLQPEEARLLLARCDVARVEITPEATTVLRQLVAEHGPLLFHQSGGCCDGSSPMCYPAREFRVGQRDVHLGDVDGVPVYIGGLQFEVWRHTQLLIDVVPGRGGGFSLEAPLGVRFLTRSRVFDADGTGLARCLPAENRPFPRLTEGPSCPRVVDPARTVQLAGVLLGCSSTGRAPGC